MRRTLVVTIDGSDKLNLCATGCATTFLTDHGVVRLGSSHTRVVDGLNGRKHTLKWRKSSSSQFCDLCGDEWKLRTDARKVAGEDTSAEYAEYELTSVEAVAAHNAAKTHCRAGHPLEGDNLVPSRLARGKRSCLTCDRDNARVRRQRSKDATR